MQRSVLAGVSMVTSGELQRDGGEADAAGRMPDRASLLSGGRRPGRSCDGRCARPPSRVPARRIPCASVGGSRHGHRVEAGARRCSATYRTEYAIYGTVLVSAVIAVGWEDDTDLEVLLFTLGSVGVFWLAHVYSGTVAREDDEPAAAPRDPDRRAGVDAPHDRAARRDGAARALPAARGRRRCSTSTSRTTRRCGSASLVLAVLGYLASARRGSPWYWRCSARWSPPASGCS